uniref:40S ribosomal protein S27 n=1 Tax=Astatotilapia calliptera TaxID=8154 RepID=A0A3P8PBE8_ASTCA
MRTLDLLHPSPEEEKRRHKKKRLVQSPNSYFMDVKCPGCYKITTVFSHAQTVVLCVGCSTVLCQPTGGKARLTEGQYSSTAGVSSDGIQWPADINADCIMHFFKIYFGGFVVEAEISRMGMIFALLMGMPLDELQET